MATRRILIAYNHTNVLLLLFVSLSSDKANKIVLNTYDRSTHCKLISVLQEGIFVKMYY